MEICQKRKVNMMKKFVKKTFSILLVLAMLFAIPLFSVAGGDSILVPYTMGDLNGDGEIKATDARTALRASAELITLADEQKAAADVFYDGKFSAVNARKILRVSAKLDKVNWIPILTAQEEIEAKKVFLELYNSKAVGVTLAIDDIDWKYVYRHDKGFMCFSYTPQMIVHDGIMSFDIGGFTFYDAHPACYFYDAENESFILFSGQNADLLSEMFSSEDLEFFSALHHVVCKMGPAYD